MRIAIVGTGISGLTCAHLLGNMHDVTVFEKDTRPGGHTNTVRVDFGDESHDVDTGFIVYNERNYPNLVRLFERLHVRTKPSDMSFSVSDAASGFEWRATSPRTAFAQRRNLLRPSFYAMLADIVRFNRAARELLASEENPQLTLGEFLDTHGLSDGRLQDWYLVPMASAIWSAQPGAVQRMPARAFARFFDNHGLLSIGEQPTWRTVDGGAGRYVEAIVGPLGDRVRVGLAAEKIVRRPDCVEVLSAAGPETFDNVIIATHSDQALALLADASDREAEILSSISYKPNTAVLHTDVHLLPLNKRVWASWNYHRSDADSAGATVTYHLNRLQSIRSRREICVTLNRPEDVDPARVLATLEYAHPVFDLAALRAQTRRSEINGRNRTWFCGAYWGYGFHEDGVRSALEVCSRLGGRL